MTAEQAEKAALSSCRSKLVNQILASVQTRADAGRFDFTFKSKELSNSESRILEMLGFKLDFLQSHSTEKNDRIVHMARYKISW